MRTRSTKREKKGKGLKEVTLSVEPLLAEELAWLAKAFPLLSLPEYEAVARQLPSVTEVAEAALGEQGCVRRAVLLRAALAIGVQQMKESFVQIGKKLPVFEVKHVRKRVPKLLKRAVSACTETCDADKAPFDAGVPSACEKAELRLLMSLQNKGFAVVAGDMSVQRLRLAERAYLQAEKDKLLQESDIYRREHLDKLCAFGTPAGNGEHRDLGRLAKRASGGLALFGEEEELTDTEMLEIAESDRMFCRNGKPWPPGMPSMNVAEELEFWGQYYGFWENAYETSWFDSFRQK